ncbi:chemotaxis response regulator protein-glutamate methylesterase [Brevundimonas bullata]|uniref:protein-glutamate methylesterase/protein-glutamine glutaminase n=1 Tax=Brevundimonas bullata TaxID=13160 RepID=UPI001B873D67|nr:chemotaxis response regulator protein-glutamate methylesterase [Brevundimonas bullata]
MPALLEAAPPPVRDPRIRVMVVDDSAIVRGLIVQTLERDPALRVVARAAQGEAALAELDRTAVDVVVLDIEMPVMDGLTALPLILKKRPEVKVIMASTLTRRNARISLQALQAGAADYVPKPETGGLVGAEDFARELTAKVKALGRSGGLPTPPTPALPVPVVRPAPLSPPIRPQVVAIGGSTGAPPALMSLFADLKGELEQAVLLTQHMPPTFTAMLAEQLERTGERPAAEARDGEPILPGRIYVAPGGWHMTVGRSGQVPVIRLNQEAPEHFCRPSVDPMLRSAAAVYGPGVLAVILTGMGADGAEGCRAVAEAGGRFVVQDEATSVVWGMPGAAAKTGLAEAVLPLPQIAPWVRRACA